MRTSRDGNVVASTGNVFEDLGMDTLRVSLEKVGKAFAAALRGVDVARDAWVPTRSDGYDLWLLVQPIDLAVEHAWPQPARPL
jgi:hypothetical protein